MHLDDKAIKGYYFWWHLYRGKLRHQPTPFAAFGLGFDVVCRAVFFLGLCWKGHMLGFDSYYTSIPLLIQLSF